MSSLTSGGKNPIVIYFEKDLKNIAKKVLDIAKKSDKELQQFYEISRLNTYRIYIAKNRVQFDELTSTKRNWRKQWYLVGTALTENDAFLLNPSKWDPRSSKFVELDQLVKHEMAHSYSISLNGKSKEREIFPKVVDRA